MASTDNITCYHLEAVLLFNNNLDVHLSWKSTDWSYCFFFSVQLADAKGMLTLEAGTARAGTSESPGDQGGSWPTREVGGITQHQAITTFPAHLNLRDPQTSQTSLHLGWASNTQFPPYFSIRSFVLLERMKIRLLKLSKNSAQFRIAELRRYLVAEQILQFIS